jgi:hypothetical protein
VVEALDLLPLLKQVFGMISHAPTFSDALLSVSTEDHQTQFLSNVEDAEDCDNKESCIQSPEDMVMSRLLLFYAALELAHIYQRSGTKFNSISDFAKSFKPKLLKKVERLVRYGNLLLALEEYLAVPIIIVFGALGSVFHRNVLQKDFKVFLYYLGHPRFSEIWKFSAENRSQHVQNRKTFRRFWENGQLEDASQGFQEDQGGRTQHEAFSAASIVQDAACRPEEREAASALLVDERCPLYQSLQGDNGLSHISGESHGLIDQRKSVLLVELRFSSNTSHYPGFVLPRSTTTSVGLSHVRTALC